MSKRNSWEASQKGLDSLVIRRMEQDDQSEINRRRTSYTDLEQALSLRQAVQRRQVVQKPSKQEVTRIPTVDLAQLSRLGTVGKLR